MPTKQSVYDRFYLVEGNCESTYVNFYVGDAPYGGWASASRNSQAGILGKKLNGLSYRQTDLAADDGTVTKKATRISRCRANKLLKEWGYNYTFPK